MQLQIRRLNKLRGMIHPMALCESDQVGARTRIWAFAHIMRGAIIGTDCVIGDGVFVESGAVLGDRVTVKNRALIWDGVTIGDDAFVGPGVVFTNDRFPRSPRMQLVKERYADPAHWRCHTQIGRGASLGAGAVILPGITIGEYAMVAAGSTVVADVGAYRLVMGTPARNRGWVCACGTRLANDTLVCEACGGAYQLDRNELRQVV